ncbi:FAD-dependent oxidoreductase, partial [Caminibacter sp.]
MKRRNFLGLMGFGILAAKTPLFGATKPRIVVIGGGFAGATCAKYLKLWGGYSVDVTLIDKNLNYTSPILSNLVLNSQKSINDLTFNYTSHQEKY